MPGGRIGRWAEGPVGARFARLLGLWWRRPWDRRLRGPLVVVLAVWYLAYALVRHRRYQTTGFDLGIFDQATRGYAGFGLPIVPLKGPGYNLLGDHFHPIIILWAPLYWIWADPRMLLAAQAVLVALSVLPVMNFTTRRFGARRALIVGVVYGLSWPLQRMIQFDVHEIAFAVPLIAFVIDQLDRRRYRWVTFGCLALLLTREDMGFFVLMAALVLVLPRPWRLRDRRWAWAGGLVAAGLTGYRVATAVVIPHFSGGAGFVYWTFGALGPDPGSAVRTVLTQPWSVLRVFVTPAVKAHTLLVLGLPTLFAGLGSRYVLLAGPFLAERFLNDREPLWTTTFHYSGVLAPIIVMAGVDTVHRLSARLARPADRPGATHRLSTRLRDSWLAWCVGALLLGALTLSGEYPLFRLFTPEIWQRTARMAAIDRVLPLIPDGVCLEADNALAPHLTGRDTVFRVDRSGESASWLVLDLGRADTGPDGSTPAEAYEQALRRGFHVVRQDDVIVLLTRPSTAATPGCRAAP